MLRLFFRLSRPVNLLIAGACYAAAAWISALRDWRFLSDSRFWLEGAVLLTVMASGYWINDVFDHKIDRINKPARTLVGLHISTKKTLTGYFVALVAALGLSALLPWKFLVLNVGAAGALYVYAHWWKRVPAAGNLLVATLTAAVFLAGAMLYHMKAAHAWAMGFAFVATFLREVTKDAEDMRGDAYHGVRTLPAEIGLRAARALAGLGAFTLGAACLAPAAWHWAERPYLYLAIIVLGVWPALGYAGYRLLGARRPEDYAAPSRALKWALGPGLAAIMALP